MRHEFVNLQPVPISAGPANTVRSTIEVAGLGDARTEDIEVTVNITHTWAADLVISLRAPDGGEVILVEREGASGDDFRNTIFRSNAQTAIKGARAPFRGTFRPEGDLASLFGKRAQGAWTLVVADKANRDGGALNRWSLGLTTNATPASEFQVRVRFLGGLSPAQQAAFAGAAARQRSSPAMFRRSCSMARRSTTF
jgi:subtilisin-like proprotein convertase family protein